MDLSFAGSIDPCCLTFIARLFFLFFGGEGEEQSNANCE